MSRSERARGTGSIAQRHTKDCPPAVAMPGEKRKRRPEHACTGPWMVSIEAGWTRSGARRQIRRTARSEVEARQLVRKLLREADTGASGAVATATVKSWSDEWLTDRVTKVDPRSYATDASAVKVWIVPTIGRRKLAHLTPSDIRSVVKAMIAAGRKPSTAIRAHTVLREMLIAAQVDGHAVPERVLKVDPPNPGESGRDAIPLDHARLIVAEVLRPAADGLSDGHGSRWVAAFRGMRPAEARGLAWNRIDFDGHRIDVSWQLQALPYIVARDPSSGFRIPVGYTAEHLVAAYHLVRPKTKAGVRWTPMDPVLEAQLLAWRRFAPTSEWDLVWPRDATELHPERSGWPRTDKDDRAQWREACEAAGVPHYDLYSARHTFATLMREQGVRDDVAIAAMGHASIASTRPYQHADLAAAAREAVEMVAGRLEPQESARS